MWLRYISGCGKSTIKVRWKYVESKAYVRFKYGKNTVLYGNFLLAPTVYQTDTVSMIEHLCI